MTKELFESADFRLAAVEYCIQRLVGRDKGLREGILRGVCRDYKFPEEDWKVLDGWCRGTSTFDQLRLDWDERHGVEFTAGEEEAVGMVGEAGCPVAFAGVDPGAALRELAAALDPRLIQAQWGWLRARKYVYVPRGLDVVGKVGEGCAVVDGRKVEWVHGAVLFMDRRQGTGDRGQAAGVVRRVLLETRLAGLRCVKRKPRLDGKGKKMLRQGEINQEALVRVWGPMERKMVKKATCKKEEVVPLRVDMDALGMRTMAVMRKFFPVMMDYSQAGLAREVGVAKPAILNHEKVVLGRMEQRAAGRAGNRGQETGGSGDRSNGANVTNNQ